MILAASTASNGATGAGLIFLIIALLQFVFSMYATKDKAEDCIAMAILVLATVLSGIAACGFLILSSIL